MRSSATVRFRHHQAVTVAAIVATIGAVPLAAVSWALAPVLLVPLAIAVWAWRAGTDASPSGVTVRALLGQRLYAWSEIAEVAAGPGGRVAAALTDGRVVPLTAVGAADLHRLLAASGQAPAAASGEAAGAPKQTRQ